MSEQQVPEAPVADVQPPEAESPAVTPQASETQKGDLDQILSEYDKQVGEPVIESALKEYDEQRATKLREQLQTLIGAVEADVRRDLDATQALIDRDAYAEDAIAVTYTAPTYNETIQIRSREGLALQRVFAMYDHLEGGFQLADRYVDWIPLMNIQYHLAVDGLSAPMILLTGLLGLAAIYSSLGVSSG